MKRFLFITAIAALTMTACGKKNSVETFDFSGKTLQLIEIGGNQYDPTSTVRPAELIFGADGTLSGKTGCNLINGTFYANADTLRFPQPMAMTRMMCDETSNNIENAMTQLLSNANRYTVTDNKISIYKDSELLGVFQIAGNKACCTKDKAQCCKNDSTKTCCSAGKTHNCKNDSTKACCNAGKNHNCKNDSTKACCNAGKNHNCKNDSTKACCNAGKEHKCKNGK